jgi:hypothetical protein
MKVPTREALQRRRVITISDLLVKAENEDWHGVADAAMDLREIDAQLAVVPVSRPPADLDAYVPHYELTEDQAQKLHREKEDWLPEWAKP